MHQAQRDPQHEAHLAQAKTALAELDTQIQLLQAKTEKHAAESRIEYGNELEELRQRRDELGERLKGLQQSGGEAWNELLSGAENAVAGVRNGLKGALERLR